MDKNISLDDLIKKDRANKRKQGGNAFGQRGGSRFGGGFKGGNRGGNLVPRNRRGGPAGIFKRNRPQIQGGGFQQGGQRPIRRNGRFGGPRI